MRVIFNAPSVDVPSNVTLAVCFDVFLTGGMLEKIKATYSMPDLVLHNIEKLLSSISITIKCDLLAAKQRMTAETVHKTQTDEKTTRG